MFRSWCLVALLAACAPGPECGEWTVEEDGVCVQVETPESEPVDVQSLLQAPEPCELPSAGDAIDLQAGCILGVCAGTSLAETEAAVGVGQCQGLGPGQWQCSWGDVRAWVQGEPNQPLDGDADILAVQVSSGPPLRDANGLGLYTPVACWLQELPPPDTVFVMNGADGVRPHELHWESEQIRVSTGGRYGFYPNYGSTTQFIELGNPYGG